MLESSAMRRAPPSWRVRCHAARSAGRSRCRWNAVLRDRSASCPMMAKMFCGGHTSAGRGYYVRQQRLSADFVQDLGMTRLEPRAFARGKNGDGEHESQAWNSLSEEAGACGCRRRRLIALSRYLRIAESAIVRRTFDCRCRAQATAETARRSSIISRSRSCATLWVSWRAIRAFVGMRISSSR